MLRLGVALLGLKITVGEVASLGWPPIILVLAAISLTILASIAAAKWMGFDPRFGVLSGGATAICGASAAMALSAALPDHPKKEQATLFTVVGVSILSTVAMIAYPAITRLLGFDDVHAGIFFGATIHDVAQVVGAGFAVSPETGNVATIVKLTGRDVAPGDPFGRAAEPVRGRRGREAAAARPPGSPHCSRPWSSSTVSFRCRR